MSRKSIYCFFQFRFENILVKEIVKFDTNGFPEQVPAGDQIGGLFICLREVFITNFSFEIRVEVKREQSDIMRERKACCPRFNRLSRFGSEIKLFANRYRYFADDSLATVVKMLLKRALEHIAINFKMLIF